MDRERRCDGQDLAGMVGGQLVRAARIYELPRIFAETSGRGGEDRFRSRPIGDEIEDLV
ncbi:hypothetical protein [Bradyrhizobium japonicum]|uniref:hypothetical protein n=1 Tax=Bradyrhizobium japonicum TaxID=375 RepID=UPI0020A0F866|nr:hypothetical protein [Bradyrhizobium japonicum]MCP1782024.1 hypothetical protein [Bradyrhizobium japonicum]MCP1965689.1 hypothetical protein [Bradyrhizobium japonicum]